MDYQFTFWDKINENGEMGKPISFRNELKYFAGKDVEITVRQKRAKRSDDQHRLYRGYLRLLSEYTGFSVDELHSVIGLKFRLVERADEKTGEVFQYIRSTTQMNRLEFADHITEIQRWCEDTFHFRLPNPGELWQISFPEK